DYQPGDVAYITGSGWQPGEVVDLLLQKSCGCDPQAWSVTADADGNIATQYQVVDADLGVAFVLTATGESSGWIATTTFTDAAGLKLLGSDNAQHITSGAEESLGSFTQGSTISLTCPRGTGLTIQATGLGGGATANWTLTYFSGYANDSVLSPVT